MDNVEIHEDYPEARQAVYAGYNRKPELGPSPKRKCDGLNAIDGTEPDSVLRQMTLICNNLTSLLTKQRSKTVLPSQQVPFLPFVSRWVDYSRKHGVGYVLADGTVGCIINASSKLGTPVTHVLVKHGRKWLSQVGKNFENIDQVPFEILEDCGEDGIIPKVYKGLGSVREGPLAAEHDRRRTLSVLWVKFGRYMCQSLEGEETDPSQDSNFVRFYQRIGTVGIWAFVDGCLQVHFPDHTKLVISADGTHISATCISPEAAAYLSASGGLLAHHVATREVFTDSIASLLFGGGRARARVVKANSIHEKLAYVCSIVGQWIKHAGLGRLGDDPLGSAPIDLYWNGLCVDDGAKKTDRVTVGRHGGDDSVKPVSVS